MTFLDYLVGGVGTFLQVLILARGVFTRTYTYYGFFYAALFYSFLESLFIIHLTIHNPTYSPQAGIWLRSISPLFGFLTAWEIYRQVFAEFSSLRVRVARILSPVLLILVGASFAADFAARPLHRFPVLAVEWQCRLAQATILAFALVFAKYYTVQLGRNILGMAYGFGLFVSVAVANLALRGQFGAAHPYVDYIYTLSTLATYGVWCWSLWHFAPSPQAQKAAAIDIKKERLAQNINAAWERALDALKRGFGQ